ncbi:transmembrane protein 71 isoform X3 [Felis catus]|uniref:Transmembrane protein 71 n=1 Tax=Felis catus TaxID=9685 RepID=A0ABI7WH90_FELCA|nr:transmembrane protein 71 isoform X3 [Felis catus]
MYRISQLMSTPVASKCSSGSERRCTGEPPPRCLFLTFACDFLDGDSSFEGCSAALLTGSHVTCRRSPRLLSNGYYVWTEDPFLCDKDGNITLSPPQASVLYKENLVRIFRKKKRIRPSFPNLFSLGASKSWQHGNIFGDVDSSLSEDTWLEGVGGLDTHHCNDIETSLWRDIFFQAFLLAACLIICACARCFLGGIFASVLTCPLVITTAYTVASLFLNLADYFEATACAQQVLTVLPSS